MEQPTLVKIAKLRTLAARQGKAFDMVRFVGDRAYAQATLKSVLDSEDEALMLLGLELMDALKMVTVNNGAAPAAVASKPSVSAMPATPAAAPAAGDRYVGGCTSHNHSRLPQGRPCVCGLSNQPAGTAARSSSWRSRCRSRKLAHSTGDSSCHPCLAQSAQPRGLRFERQRRFHDRAPRCPWLVAALADAGLCQRSAVFVRHRPGGGRHQDRRHRQRAGHAAADGHRLQPAQPRCPGGGAGQPGHAWCHQGRAQRRHRHRPFFAHAE